MRTIVFLYIIYYSSIANGQDWASQSGGFLRMGMTARSIAMGGGFTAELDKSFPVFHNPAWAAFLSKKHFGSSYSNLTLDRRLATASLSMPLPPTAGIGLSWVYGGVSDIQGRYTTGMKSMKMQTGENAFMITFSQRIISWISIGANFKYLRYDLPITEDGQDPVEGSGIGFDIGLIIGSGENKIGIMVQDISSNYQWDTNKLYTKGGPYKEEFATIYRLGSRYSNDNFLFVADMGIITDHNNYFGIIPRIGAEYEFIEQYSFRGGFGNGRMGFGFGYEYKLYRSYDSSLDYSFSLDWASQSAHTISYAFTF